ncbi:MAG: mechanosensitive ion channel family protein [Alphaproteobacteria bacterium]|nr:mechanosensitive ion channel family protein [Alphaproteobacteria bacterium]
MPVPKIASAGKSGGASDGAPLIDPSHLNLTQKTDRLVAESSAWVSGHVLDILIAAGIGVAIAVALLGLRSLGCKLLGRWGRDPHWPVIFARVLAKTKVYFIVLLSAELVASHAYTPPGLMSVVHAAFVVAFAIQAAVWARELVLGYLEHRVGANEGHSTLGSAVSIIRLLVTVTLFAIAIILILSNLGVNVTGLVAGLGVGGIAIGLAAQGIFSDLFAALSIIFDKPFRKGDTITFGQVNGSVENIGLKTTRVRAVSGEEVVVANAKLLDQQIHNFARLKRRRIVLKFGLATSTPPDKCRQVPDIAAKVVGEQPKTGLVRCGMTGFGDSSFEFELQADVQSTDYDVTFATRNAIAIGLMEALGAAEIEFSNPSQTVFFAAPDGTLVAPPGSVKPRRETE